MAEKKLKATERLSALEELVVQMRTTLGATAKRTGEMELIVFNLSRENEVLKEALTLLNEKQLAIISLNNEGKVFSDDNINGKVVSLKELALKGKISALAESGDILAIDEVEDQSLIVSRELNEKGEVENPRLQFLVGRLIPELKDKFLGKKVGDLIKGEESKLDIEIMEIYRLVEKEIEQTNEGPSAESSSSEETEEKVSEETKE
jgi:hypothetical protein